MAAVSETAALPLHGYSNVFIYLFIGDVQSRFLLMFCSGFVVELPAGPFHCAEETILFVVLMITEWKPARRGKTGQKGESRSNGKIL